VRHRFASLTATVNGQLSSVSALPSPVAWTWALNAAYHREAPIAFEGAGPELSSGVTRLSEPDWNTVSPMSHSPFAEVNLLTTVRDCSTSPCSAGLSLTVGGAVQQIPGTPAYDGVFAPATTPTSGFIAFVQNLATGGPQISVAQIPFILNDWRAVPLTAGTEPDWQPTAPFPG
jgi:hypothetical protein